MARKKPEFDVALSFAGEDREFVESVALRLRQMGLNVFYDRYETVSLWGKDLYGHLCDIYETKARYTVMFISRHYKSKLWTNHERRSAQARAFKERAEYILPARFDTTKIPGVLSTIGYMDLRHISPEELAKLIQMKIGPIPRPGFFPEHPDRLFSQLKVKREKDRRRIVAVAYNLFSDLKLMTLRERQVLAEAAFIACADGLPDNIHMNLDYLCRRVGATRDEVLSIFAHIDCFGIHSKISDEIADDEPRLGHAEKIEITYYAGTSFHDTNDTDVLAAFFRAIQEEMCPECTKLAIEKLDMSPLSSLTFGGEDHRVTSPQQS